MAIYHLSAQLIQRSSGRSSVAASAYRSGEKLEDQRTGLNHDYTRKSGIEHTEILAPSNSPEWVKDREKLWNEVEKSEKRKDSQLAREINIALPIELNDEQQIDLTRGFVKENFVDKGMIADIAIHGTNTENPHAHVMLTTREITSEGFGKKNREWNDKELLEQWRQNWAEHSNSALEKAGREERVDHRSLKEQGIDREAQIHMGVSVKALEEKGVKTDRGDIYRDIKETNKKLKEIKEEKVVLLGEYRKAKEDKNKSDFYWKQFNSNEKDTLLKSQSVLNKFATIENIKSGYGFIDKKINFWDGLQQKLSNKMNPYKEADNTLSNLKDTKEEYKNATMFSQERRDLKEKISELESKFKKQTDYLQKYSKYDLSTENKFEKVYGQLSEEEVKKRANYNKGSKEWTDKKELLFKAENILSENELKKLMKAYPEYDKFRNNLSQGTASAINEINRVMHKKLSLDEITKLGDKSHVINNENKRLARAEGYLKEHDNLMKISSKYEKGFGPVKRLFSNNKENEYKELQQKINTSKDNLKNCNVINREDLNNQREKLNKQIEDLPSSFRSYELKNKERELSGKSYQLYKQEEQYKKAGNIINDLKESRNKIKGISSLLHDNKEVNQKIQALEGKFIKCNVGNEKDFEKNSSAVMQDIEKKKNHILEQRKDISQNLDLSGVYDLSVRARNAAIELQNKMFINEHYNENIKELGEVVNGIANERNISSKEIDKIMKGVNDRELRTRGEANPGRDYNFDGKLGGLPTKGNRHIEISPIKLVGHNQILQGTDREGQRNNNTEIQRDGGSNKQVNSNDTRQLLEGTTGGIEKGKGNNAIRQDGNDTRSETNDRKVSTKDRTSIFSKNSNSIFSSGFKSSLSANIQDSAKLDKELLKQIEQNKADKEKDVKEDKGKGVTKSKSYDRER